MGDRRMRKLLKFVDRMVENLLSGEEDVVEDEIPLFDAYLRAALRLAEGTRNHNVDYSLGCMSDAWAVASTKRKSELMEGVS